MKRFRGLFAYPVIFALGMLAGSHFGGQSVDAYVRAIVAGESQPTNRQASVLQKVSESEGSGEGWTDPFSLQQGRVMITVQHKGNGPLSFRLVDQRSASSGASNGPGVMVAGEFDSWKIAAQTHIDTPGTYLLGVDAAGDWKTTVAQ